MHRKIGLLLFALLRGGKLMAAELQSLLARADIALYRAKSLGRNRVEFGSADQSAAWVAD